MRGGVVSFFVNRAMGRGLWMDCLGDGGIFGVCEMGFCWG